MCWAPLGPFHLTPLISALSLAPSTCSGEWSKNLQILSLPEPARPPSWALPAAPSPGRLQGGAWLVAAGRWVICQKLPQNGAGAAQASGTSVWVQALRASPAGFLLLQGTSCSQSGVCCHRCGAGVSNTKQPKGSCYSKEFKIESLRKQALAWLHQRFSWPEPDAGLWQNHLSRKQGNYTSGLFVSRISSFLFAKMKCKHLSNVVCCVVQTVKHLQQHCYSNMLWLGMVRRAHIAVRNQKNFDECNKICTDSESWTCFGQWLSAISTISCSAYFNTLLSTSIKQGV